MNTRRSGKSWVTACSILSHMMAYAREGLVCNIQSMSSSAANKRAVKEMYKQIAKDAGIELKWNGFNATLGTAELRIR